MNQYHLAQINIGRIKGVDINDPVMKEFVDNLGPGQCAGGKQPGVCMEVER